MNPPIELYTDGSCINNPGPGGIGYIIRYYEETDEKDMPKLIQLEKSQGYRFTTNNRMEISASIFGLYDIINMIKDKTIIDSNVINLYSDSKYFCDAVNQRWINKWVDNQWMTSGFKNKQPKPVKNKDLWEQVLNIQAELSKMNVALLISHIPGHQGYEFNEKCDKLAKSGSDDTNSYLIDEGYEKNNKR